MGIDNSGYQSPPIVALYVLAAISACCSCSVVFSILRFSPLKITLTRLVLYLHLTLILEDVVSLPYAYVESDPGCRAVGFLRYYSSLSNVCVVGCLVVLYRNIIFEDSLLMLKNIINKWSEWIVFGFPLITCVLPFITRSFGTSDDTWCVIKSGQKGNWMSFLALYVWAWIILTLAILCMIRTVIQVYRVDKEMTSKLVGSVGLYVIVTILAWIPRTEGRMRRTIDHTSYTGFYVETMVLYGSGLFYCLIFMTEKQKITRFESFSNNNEFRFSEDNRDSSSAGGGGAKSLTEGLRPASGSIFKNPFYRGSNVSDKHKSTDSPLVVTLVENPVQGDRTRSHNSSSGKVVFEGLDEKLQDSNL